MNMSNRIKLAAILGVVLLAGCGERPPVTTVQLGFRGTGMEQNYNPRLQEKVAAANQVGAVQPAADPSGPLAKDIYQNVEVLSDLSVGEFVRVMTSMTEWVAPAEQKDCTYCHNIENMGTAASTPTRWLAGCCR
jgi:photosynthetic reaction center cytochrome c subunit